MAGRGTILDVYFVLLAAALAIMAGVVAVAMGWGGEMAEFTADRPTTPIWLATAADVAELRLPLRLLGYQQQATDEALRAVTVVLAAREAEIARLRAKLAELAGASEPAVPSASGAVVPPPAAPPPAVAPPAVAPPAVSPVPPA